jgi:hypothetical protein
MSNDDEGERTQGLAIALISQEPDTREYDQRQEHPGTK